MKRSIEEITSAIHNMDFQLNGAFKKCKESAPLGYEFLTNVHPQDTIYYKDQDYIVLPIAYNMFGDLIDGDMSVYRKKGTK